MILGSSKDPVLIKKIYLRVWTLRDEVEAVIKARIEAGETENLSVEDLIEEYKSKSLIVNDGSVTLEVLNGGKTEDDKMLDVAPEEGSETKSEEQNDEANNQEETEVAASDANEAIEPDVPKDAPVNVIQRRPDLPADKIYNGTTVLTELNMDEMYFFSNQSFLEGQSIVIEFLIPNKFIVNANVFYSRPYNLKSRIIRDNNLIYRVAVKFSFLKPGERTLLRQFVQSVEPDLSKHAKPQVAPKKVDDGFDDLDDLDL